MNKCIDCGKEKNNKGRCKKCFSIFIVGKNNPNWKGDNVGKSALHGWVKRRMLRPLVCAECKIGFPIDLANISQEYKRDLSDWEWLCRKCHMTKDGRIERLELTRPVLKGKDNYWYGKSLKGEKSHSWKGGWPKCSVCKIELKNRYAKHCIKHNPRKPAFIKTCMDCKKIISGGKNHGAKRCKSCCKVGKVNPNFKHGRNVNAKMPEVPRIAH